MLLLSSFLMLQVGCASEEPAPGAQPADTVSRAPSQSAQLTPDELDQLVAPIALYPDALVAQILAASSYPTAVVEADRWLQQHSGVTGQSLAGATDQQPWDPSVKALTQFPSVLAMMDKNLSWTSTLGQAYVENAQNVMDAVQLMRRRAQQSGNLKSTSQESVTTNGQTIVIEPADPEIVFLPEYDPWIVYGGPIAFYPGWIGVPGVFYDGPGIYFGLGVGIGIFGGFGWGWHHWAPDWHGHSVMWDHQRFVSHSPTFFDRGHADFYRGAVGHPDFGRPDLGHANVGRADFGHLSGFGGRSLPAARPGAFGGFNHGGLVSAFSVRGRASFGGGFHGGGGHR